MDSNQNSQSAKQSSRAGEQGDLFFDQEVKELQSVSESENGVNAEVSKQAEINAIRQASLSQGFELKFSDDSLGVAVFIWVKNSNDVYLYGFAGKRTKPDFKYRFRSMGSAELYLDNWHKERMQWAKDKAERRAEAVEKLALPHSLSVGDVLVASWGYEQTNIDYYQVVRLIGKRSVEIRELMQLREETGFMSGDCVPVKDAFRKGKEPLVRRVTKDDTVKILSWGVYAGKMEVQVIDGVAIFRPDRYSCYA